MAAVGWILLAVLAGGAAAGWRWYRHPGARAHAFGEEHAALRGDLTAARRKVRDEVRAERRERVRAERVVKTREAEHRERIRAVEERLAELLDPGSGEEIDTLGDLTLFEHVLASESRELPLSGLRVSVRSGREGWQLRLRSPHGRAWDEAYPREQFDEHEVRRFAGRIERAVGYAERFDGVQQRRIDDTEDELAEVRADTAAADEARAALADLLDRHRRDGRSSLARAELEAVRKRWQAVTGHLPPR
ncbi:hypothetical protein [Kitasatospora sp. NPDC059571]|uniref:hypothetical protein n=1 Tax=Kitasatospora sp. NPDC059571 TaxID=3346871 RepID=UPI0036815F9F